MAATEKRSASNAFGTSQMVVKRQKSSDNLSSSTAVAVAESNGNGALIQSVRAFASIALPSQIPAMHTDAS